MTTPTVFRCTHPHHNNTPPHALPGSRFCADHVGYCGSINCAVRDCFEPRAIKITRASPEGFLSSFCENHHRAYLSASNCVTPEQWLSMPVEPRPRYCEDPRCRALQILACGIARFRSHHVELWWPTDSECLIYACTSRRVVGSHFCVGHKTAFHASDPATLVEWLRSVQATYSLESTPEQGLGNLECGMVPDQVTTHGLPTPEAAITDQMDAALIGQPAVSTPQAPISITMSDIEVITLAQGQSSEQTLYGSQTLRISFIGDNRRTRTIEVHYPRGYRLRIGTEGCQIESLTPSPPPPEYKRCVRGDCIDDRWRGHAFCERHYQELNDDQ